MNNQSLTNQRHYPDLGSGAANVDCFLRLKFTSQNFFLIILPVRILSQHPLPYSFHTVPNKPKEETFPFGLLTGGLSFLTIILLTAIVVIICKRRQTPEPNGAAATILVRDSESGYG